MTNQGGRAAGTTERISQSREHWARMKNGSKESSSERTIRKDLFQWYLATTTGGVDIRTAAMIPMTTLHFCLRAWAYDSAEAWLPQGYTHCWTCVVVDACRKDNDDDDDDGPPGRRHQQLECSAHTILRTRVSGASSLIWIIQGHFPFSLARSIRSFGCRPLPPTIHPESYPNNKTNIQFGLICAPWTIRMLIITTAAGDKNSTTTTKTKVASGQTWLNVGFIL